MEILSSNIYQSNFGLWGCLVWLPDCHSGKSDGFEFHRDREREDMGSSPIATGKPVA